MRFYPQLLLWTYFLLPAISLLLTPSFIMAVARAQQQRARVMSNALAARGKAAAALARNQQRRYVSTNKYSNSFGQNRPFKLRSKRDLDLGVSDIDLPINGKQTEVDNFGRKSHGDQQEEALDQLENMWNMDNFGNNENNEGVMRSMHAEEPRGPMGEIVGEPYLYSNKDSKNNIKSNYYSGAFSSRNVFDDFWEPNEPTSHMRSDISSFTDDRSANPEPTIKKKKKKFAQKYDINSYPQSYNSYYSQQPYSGPYYRSVEFDNVPENMPVEADDIPETTPDDVPFGDDIRLANPEPTFKKKKKKFGQEHEPYSYPHTYNSYYSQQPYSGPYYRSVEFDNVPENMPVEADDIPETTPDDVPIGDDIRLANPEPTFKKKKKKFGQEHEPYPYPQTYNSYYPQYSSVDFNYYPYYRNAEEDNAPNGPVDINDTKGKIVGVSPFTEDRSANPEPTFKKKKKKFHQKQDHSYPQNYNSYYSQHPYSGSYYRSVQFDDVPESIPIEARTTGMTSDDVPLIEAIRSANPEPTFKKKKKKLEHNPQSYYNSYYPHYSSVGYNNYNPYYRNVEFEDIPQNEPVEVINGEAKFTGELFPQDMEPILTEPEPTFDKKNNNFGKPIEYGHHPQSYYSPYSNLHYNPHSRSPETEKLLFNLGEQQMDNFVLSELISPRFADPEPTFKKKKDEIQHMPPSFYYPQYQYNSYYAPNPNSYSNNNYKPYYRSSETEKLVHDGATDITDNRVGESAPFEVEQKSASAEARHKHQKIDPKQDDEKMFFYSSNFYERDHKGGPTENGETETNKQKQQNNTLQNPVNKEAQDQKTLSDFINPSDEVVSSIQNSEYVDHTLNNKDSNSENVGCELDKDLFDLNSANNQLSPNSYYYRTAEGISEESKKFAEAAKKLFHVQDVNSGEPLTPVTEEPVKPEVSHVSFEEIPENVYKSGERSHDDLSSLDRMEEKSANPNADPHLHSRGQGHTHTHFHSFTHGHSHQKTLGNHGIHNVYPATPQIQLPPTHPHSQGYGNGAFSHANAQNFNQRGIHNNFGPVNSNSFGSNAGTAQSGAQSFSSGGFGQSAATATSIIQNAGHINNFGSNSAIAQSEAQSLNTGGLGQSTASASSIIQNGPQIFNPNVGIIKSEAQAFTNEEFGQSAAQAAAQTSLIGQNFRQGFHDTQGFSGTNSQIVGEQHRKESFVMPHLDEIPVRELLTEMESNTHRISRTPQELQDSLKGLELTSNIVDASLNKHSLMDDNERDILKVKPGDDHKITEFVPDIVDSSLKVGDDITQSLQAPSPSSASAESTRFLTLQEMSSITDLVSRGLRNKRQDSRPLGDYASKSGVAQNSKGNMMTGQNFSPETTAEADKDVVLRKSYENGLQTSNKHVGNVEQNLKANKNGKHEVDMEAALINENNTMKLLDTNVKIKEDVLRMLDPKLLISTSQIVTNEPRASNWDYENNRVIHDIPESKSKSTKDISNDSEITKTNKSSAEDNFNNLNQNVTSKNITETTPVFFKELINMSNASELNRDNKSLAEDEFRDVNPNTVSKTITEDIRIFDKESPGTFPGVQKPKKSMENPGIDVVIQDKSNNSLLDTAMNKVEQKPEEFNSESKDKLYHFKDDSTVEVPHQQENDMSVKRNQYFGGRDNDVTIKHENDRGIIKRNYENTSYNDSKVKYEGTRLEAPEEVLLSHLFYANGTRKNISNLTSDEIQDIQFDLPVDINKANIAINPEHENRIGDDISLGKSLDDNKNGDTKQNITIESRRKDDGTLELLAENSTKIKIDFLNILRNDSQLSHNNTFKTILLEKSKNPFASIEAEMSVLTEAQKDAFIRKEIDLIMHVIEETLNNEDLIEEFNVDNNNTTKIIKNDTTEATHKESVLSPNLFQGFARKSNRKDYSRQARSAQPNEEVFEGLLGANREKVEKIKNLADEDEDLLLISFIGDSVIKDLEIRRNKSSRVNQSNQTSELSKTNNSVTNLVKPASPEIMTLSNLEYFMNGTNETNRTKHPRINKREIISARTSRTPLTQLLSDPMTKLDVDKTLQNLGSIARHTFENPRAPMYHVRNMLGNAKDSVMSAARVPPNNFLVPSKYEIAKISKNVNKEKVGAINQQMLFSRSGFQNAEAQEHLKEPESASQGSSFGLEDTFQKIGGLVKESVQSGRDAVTHVNDVAADAKKILHTTKYATPRLILPPKPPLTPTGSYLKSSPDISSRGLSPLDTRSDRKLMLITPRILEIQDNIVGAGREHPRDFIGMGHILDVAGLTQPDQPEVNLQTIEFDPLRNLNIKHLAIPKTKVAEIASKIEEEDDFKKEKNVKSDQSTILGAQRSNNVASPDLLPESEHAVVTENLMDFMQRMHDEMKEIVRSQYEERKRKRKEKIKKPITKPYHMNKKNPKNYKKPSNILGATNQFINTRNNFNENVKTSSSPESFNLFPQIPQRNLHPNIRESEDDINKGLNIPRHSLRIQETSRINNFRSPNQDISLRASNYVDEHPYEIQNSASPLKNPKNYYDTYDEGRVKLYLPENLLKSYTGQRYDDARREQDLDKVTSNAFNSKYVDREGKKEEVAAFVPPELMKPFMGQASEALLHSYLQENGDEDVFKQESPKPIPIIPESTLIPALNKIPYVIPKVDSRKTVISPESPITSDNLEVSNINLSGSSIPGTIIVKQEFVPKTTLKSSENPKELVELLSDPDQSELSEHSLKNSSNYLQYNIQNKLEVNDTLESNKPMKKLYLLESLLKSGMSPRSNDRQSQQVLEQDTSNASNSKYVAKLVDQKEDVATFVPLKPTKPFMDPAPETLLHKYLREKGEEDAFEQGSIKQIPKTPEATLMPSLNKIPPKFDDSRKTVILPEASITSNDAEAPKINPSSNLSTVVAQQEIIGASMPTTTRKLSEKTKELVELLSDPKIDESELSEHSLNNSSNSLDYNVQNNLEIKDNLESNKPMKEPSTKNTSEMNLKEPNKKHPSALKNDDGEEFIPDTVKNMKPKPSSSGINTLKVDQVPNEDDLGYVLGAINPMMFERYFKERLKINDTSSKDTHDQFVHHGVVNDENESLVGAVKVKEDDPKENQLDSSDSLVERNDTEQPSVKKDEAIIKELKLNQNYNGSEYSNQEDKEDVEAKQNLQQQKSQREEGNDGDPHLEHPSGRTSMKVIDPFKKPFMGFITPKKMNTFLNQYNNKLPASNEYYQQQEKDYIQYKNDEQDVEPAKYVVFSSLDDEDNYANGF